MTLHAFDANIILRLRIRHNSSVKSQSCHIVCPPLLCALELIKHESMDGYRALIFQATSCDLLEQLISIALVTARQNLLHGSDFLLSNFRCVNHHHMELIK